MGLGLTNLCISLINHCKAFTDADFGSFIVESAIGANKYRFSQERAECLVERCVQLYFMLHRGPYSGPQNGCRDDIILKPLTLSLQVLKCSVKNVVVRRDLLDLSRKCKEHLDPFRVITC